MYLLDDWCICWMIGNLTCWMVHRLTCCVIAFSVWLFPSIFLFVSFPSLFSYFWFHSRLPLIVNLLVFLPAFCSFVPPALTSCATVPAPCRNGATCLSSPDKTTVSCQCAPGYEGKYCELDIKECDAGSKNAAVNFSLASVSSLRKLFCRAKSEGCE